jgi:hypothetical protein
MKLDVRIIARGRGIAIFLQNQARHQGPDTSLPDPGQRCLHHDLLPLVSDPFLLITALGTYRMGDFLSIRSDRRILSAGVVRGSLAVLPYVLRA